MNENFKPSVDPWELLLEHNERIQRLEKKIELIQHNQHEIVKAVTHLQELYEVNKRTVDKILENQQASTGLIADILNRSTPFSSGNH